MKRLLLFIAFIISGFSYAFAQREVSGRVTDSRDGSPVAGASVTVKGSRAGTTTNADGNFRISAPANSVLVISSIGFAEMEVNVGDNTSVDIVLQFATQSMQEVVVTGYTVQNKRTVAGSISKINADEIRFQPVGSFDKTLQGKVPGLLAQSQTGQPGAAAVVTIRGKGSIAGTNTPIYIVDGVQVTAADFSSLNPNDIESYDVLKDASSTSIYGSRGANGVIVITTKRGTLGKTRVNYDFQYGWSQLPPTQLELMNSAQKLDYEVNYDRPDGKNPFGWTQAEIDSLSKIDNGLDDVLFRKGITQQHNLSLSGGNNNTRFFVSGSIFDQEGIILTTHLKRYTGRANLENSFGDFKVGLNASFGYSRQVGTRENDQYIGSPLNAINWFNPYVSLFDANGDYQDDDFQGQPNPLRELLENYNDNDEIKGVGNVFIEWRLPWVNGLRARTSWGADFREDEATNYLDRTTNAGGQSTGANGQLARAFSKLFRYTGTTSLTYQRIFGDHDLNVSVFNELIQSKFEGFNFTGFGLVGPFKNEAGITPGTPTNGYIPVVGGNGTASGLVSYFADAVYGFKRKYYVNAGVRRDGSSRLSDDQRWSTFGQVGLGWIVSEEDFLAGSRSWLDELKLKASYGSVGSQGIGDFGSQQLLSPTFYNGVGGLLLTQLQTNVTWERKVMFNTGVEFTMLKSRVGGTVEVYDNETRDLFLNRQLSRTSGFASVLENLGKMRNRGIEVSLRGDVIRTKDFTWGLSANYTHNQNRLLSLPGQDENINGLFITKEGERFNSLYVVRYAGVDPQTGDALYYRKDGKTTTNIYDPSDAVIVGTIDPPNFGGFSTNLNYKGLELDVLFSYAFGHVTYNNDRVNVENPVYWFSRMATSVLREWQQPGDITDIPSPFNDFHPETDRFVEKADYLRLRNVTLGYELPRSLVNRWKINSLRVFAQGQNLHVWHNFQGYDPEITTGILGGAQYPQLRTYTFGVSLGL